MYELDSRIRELIDIGAPPIRLEELEVPRRRAEMRTRRRPSRITRRPGLVVFPAIALALAAGAIVINATVGRGHDAAIRVSAPPGTGRRSSQEWMRFEHCGYQPGCPATPKEVAALFGVPIATPSEVPTGWQLARSYLVVYPRGYPGVPDRPIPVYHRTWARPGTDFSRMDASYITLRQRVARQGEAAWYAGHATGHLADGTPFVASLGSPADAFAMIEWVRGSVVVAVLRSHVPYVQQLQFANSLADAPQIDQP